MLLVSLCAVSAFAAPPTALAPYYRASEGGGDAERGRRLFAERRTACATCHSVDGSGGKVGPDLRGVADKFDRAGLARAVLEPSADVLPGYETTAVVLKSGATLTGVLRFADAQAVELTKPDGATARVERSEIDELRVLPQSTMPENRQVPWTTAEFADTIAYLETLHAPPPTGPARADNPQEIPRAARGLRFEEFVPPGVGLRRPVWFGNLLGEPGAYLVAEIETARIWRIAGAPAAPTKHPFADLHATTRHGYIEGILGLALHPDFAKNRRYFVAMHDPARDRVAVGVWERRAAADGRTDGGAPPRKLLTLEMPHINHNGCCLAFGPDGFLYVGIGDGGPQEDPNGYSQSLRSPLGKILRIDVNAGGDAPYAAPADNPFRKTPDARPEIWALGFREPWRMTFDRRTGDLWVGDVGQNRFEEVAIVKAGENHGWNVFEGFEPFSNRRRRTNERYTPPVLSYSHRHGVSVTGGYVYRGRRAPTLAGMYVFGDFETRRVWGLTRANGKIDRLVELGRSPSRIAAFGEDADGELYLVGHDPSAIYRLDLAAVDPTPIFPHELVATSEKAGLLWRHRIAPPPNGWQAPEFDDRAWERSPGGFGTRGTPGAVVRTEWRTSDIWLRRDAALSVADVARAGGGTPMLRIHHDEDAEVYINGVLAAEPRSFVGGYVEMPISPEAAKTLHAGRNTLAVHCRQTRGGQYIDVGLIDYRQAPATGK